MRICIVDDNEALNEALKTTLEDVGYKVDSFTDSVVAEKYLLQNHIGYGVIILDLMMPFKTGLEICTALRKSSITTPILLLTAVNKLENKVDAFECGADDYLTKPFLIPELLARIKALARRTQAIVL